MHAALVKRACKLVAGLQTSQVPGFVNPEAGFAGRSLYCAGVRFFQHPRGAEKGQGVVNIAVPVSRTFGTSTGPPREAPW